MQKTEAEKNIVLETSPFSNVLYVVLSLILIK